MNKQELIDAVAASTGDTKAATGAAIDAILNAVPQAVTAGDAVQLIGFGAFSIGERAARVGRNPSTGEELQIAAAKTVKFTAGKADAVNANCFSHLAPDRSSTQAYQALAASATELAIRSAAGCAPFLRGCD
ncbi:nucleoid DNA-binding protein [Paraburkholderia atlantica]|uniref:Nucleoid DNA-binding protein n=1 Tax=Paraburkholderia atlantica TaxID=2654982 RepID=A0A6I1Q8A6_PARAM|nr:nucleoid DNA-binding protein [Paraburkholderia atlantica]MBB5429332.1 nucleoid DNA-binding protein [Paraburkholderia atlantica]MPW11319.1 hypothetical protein [Paraburkholderia atlantica]